MIIDYPEEIKKAMEIYEPYMLKAYKKVHKWAWEQEQ